VLPTHSGREDHSKLREEGLVRFELKLGINSRKRRKCSNGILQ
jgi:hypothetical protein